MIFNSFDFLIFFSAVFILYYIINPKLQLGFLILASSVFIMYYVPAFIIVLSVVILFNYFTGIQIDKASTEDLKKRLFIFSTVINIGILVFYKYINFIIDNINGLSHIIHTNASIPHLSILLPLGISFYIFQVISYNYDIYWEIEESEKHLGRFAAFLMFFPKFISGPIERASSFLPQLTKPKEFNNENIVSGLQLLLWGLFKKVVIADRIAIITDLVYSDIHNYNGLAIAITVILYAFQIYADFSGYTDMALGIARMLGYKLTDNFNRPFSATSISDFWRRWHITLSSWVTDYIYKPVSATRRAWGKLGTIYALFLTFIVLGIWHGASWNFIFYGFLNALAVTYEFLSKDFRKKMSIEIPAKIYTFISNIITISYFAFTLVFFRVVTFADATEAVKRIFTNFTLSTHGLGLGISLKDAIIIILGILAILLIEKQKSKKGSFYTLLKEKPVYIRWSLYYMVILSIMFFGRFGANSFIYFQF